MNKFNVLIVDDLPANLLTIKSLIEHNDIMIFEAFSGEEALKEVLLNEIDLILLDVQMPKMNGFEVAEILRDNKKTSSIPIIFVTAIDRNEELSFKGYQLGAVDFLYKPINKILLKSKVDVFMKLFLSKKDLEIKNTKLEVINKELKETESKILAMANTDSLTKIANRRSLYEEIDKSWRKCFRDKCAISFIMIDIDNFKFYNDNFGHIMGDRTLIETAQAIKKSLFRAYDIVGRFGGEEFLVLLPNTDHQDALIVAEKIRKNVYNLKIEHSKKAKYPFVSVSLGVSSIIPQKDIHYEKIIEQADHALLVSKNSGKNKVSEYSN